MTADFGIIHRLWRYAADSDLLDRAVGEIGVRHLTVPVVGGEECGLRLRDGGGPRQFATEGGWHFPPHAPRYSSSSIRPRTARWLGRRDVLAQVCDRAAARGLRVVALLNVPAAVGGNEQDEHVLRRNAWGETIARAGGCPLQPELRELLAATLADLERYDLAGYMLAGWEPDSAAGREALGVLDWSPVAQRLLNTCFCAACRQVATIAGADPDHAARSATVHLERLMVTAGDASAEDAIRRDETLLRYDGIRREANRLWLRQLTLRYARREWYVLWDCGDARDAANGIDNVRPVVRIRRGADSVRDHSPEQVLRRHGAAGVAIHAWRPTFHEGSALVRWINEAVERGVWHFDFDGVDESPDEALVWLRQAVRFARRAS